MGDYPGGSQRAAKQQLKGSVRNSYAMTRKDNAGYGHTSGALLSASDRKFVHGHGLWLTLLGLPHSGESLAEVKPKRQTLYARRASSSRTGCTNPFSRSSPSSTRATPAGGADSATLWLTSTCPAVAWAAMRAARLTVRPK